jgi:large subunit ribosomal protein L29
MKAAALREKSTGELLEMELELREQFFRLKMNHYTGQLDKVPELRATKRDIARIMTILRERAGV